MKRTSLRRRTPLGRSKKAKTTQVDLWRRYGLSKPSTPRYTGLKGIYWTLLSEHIRKRDFAQFGACISCNLPIEDWRGTDAGHYIPAATGGFELLFDPMNIHMQCKRCNNPVWSPGALIGYERYLDERYGSGTAKKLEDRYWKHRQNVRGTVEWSELQYDRKIRELLDVLQKQL